MNQVGPRNLITDVPGILVGNAEDAAARSGVSVVIPEAPAVAAVDMRGGGPGTRETDILRPETMVQKVHAVALSGGSAFGLAAADGVMGWLAAQGRGFEVRGAVVPLVPTAILFDLLNGGDKDWGEDPPYRGLGRAAAEAASGTFALGNAGAGLGATAGAMKGGLGSASAIHDRGYSIGALAAVNPSGSVLMPGSGTFWAWAFERDGELGRQTPPPCDLPRDQDYEIKVAPGLNTTMVVVATDALLTQSEAHRVAIMAQDGVARAIRPVHTPFDGDTVFVLATGRQELENSNDDVARIGLLAADCTARAIARGVYEAESLGEMVCYRERFGAKPA